LILRWCGATHGECAEGDQGGDERKKRKAKGEASKPHKLLE
jgi:hypothetical protein